MIGINGHIFACGGYDGDDELKTVEKYSIEKDEWSFVSPMKFKREEVVIVALGKYLYALGGLYMFCGDDEVVKKVQLIYKLC